MEEFDLCELSCLKTVKAVSGYRTLISVRTGTCPQSGGVRIVNHV